MAPWNFSVLAAGGIVRQAQSGGSRGTGKRKEITLIHRKAAINKAQCERDNKAREMLHKEPEDIPRIIDQWGQGIVNGARKYFAKQERASAMCDAKRTGTLCLGRC